MKETNKPKRKDIVIVSLVFIIGLIIGLNIGLKNGLFITTGMLIGFIMGRMSTNERNK